MKKKLVRDVEHTLVGGVVAGLANYFDHDITLWRIVFILALVFSGFFPLIFVYLIAWVIMPAGTNEPIVSYVVKE